MLMFDKLTVGDVRRTADGYLVADARISRVGIQTYHGFEIGKPEMDKVRVYRSEEEVFHQDSLSSFAHRPITLDHPPVSVNARNWKKYAVGIASDEVVRDGGFVRIPMMVTDQAAIDAWEGGKRELSNGYDCELKFTPGVTKDGEPYDAIQTRIRGNHIAIVDAGRAGPHCRIGDNNPDQEDHDMNLKKIIFDGLSIEVTDAGAEVIAKLQDQLKDANTAKDGSDTKVATLSTQVATKDAEIATLKTQLEDAKVTPQQMRDAAKKFAKVVDDAKKLAPKLAITDAMDELAIRKAVVSAKLSDACTGWTDAQIETSFATLAAGLGSSAHDPVRDVLRDGVIDVSDAKAKAAKARADYEQELRDGYKRPAAATA